MYIPVLDLGKAKSFLEILQHTKLRSLGPEGSLTFLRNIGSMIVVNRPRLSPSKRLRDSRYESYTTSVTASVFWLEGKSVFLSQIELERTFYRSHLSASSICILLSVCSFLTVFYHLSLRLVPVSVRTERSTSRSGSTATYIDHILGHIVNLESNP